MDVKLGTVAVTVSSITLIQLCIQQKSLEGTDCYVHLALIYLYNEQLALAAFCSRDNVMDPGLILMSLIEMLGRASSRHCFHDKNSPTSHTSLKLGAYSIKNVFFFTF